ncbi:hypothetical protein SAZ11_44625 [Streptomyces sp. FXJ1.4098]|nr:hypothetical protein [Streptomyces sp. FXJ1.4098]
MGSLSKSVWGGPRVGWIRATRPVIGRLARLRAVHDLGGNFPAQLAAAELLPRLETLCQDMAADRQARHDHLRVERAQQLPQWQAPPVTGGQTLWARLPHGDGDSFDQTALRHGVAVLPGSGLDASGAARSSFASTSSPPRCPGRGGTSPGDGLAGVRRRPRPRRPGTGAAVDGCMTSAHLLPPYAGPPCQEDRRAAIRSARA